MTFQGTHGVLGRLRRVFMRFHMHLGKIQGVSDALQEVSAELKGPSQILMVTLTGL